MKKPAISIIVPVYNAEKYLRDCLTSIQNQTFGDFEVICVNDGSTDGSLNILEEFANRDGRFRVVEQKNQGVNAARANGYKKARGEYIAWVDADDFANPDMYEKMYEVAKRTDSDTVICNYDFFPKGVAQKKKWYNSYCGVTDWKFVSDNTVQWNKVVRKRLLDRLDIVSLFEEIGEGCYSLVLIESDGIVTIDEPLYNYRVGHESLSHNFNDVEWYKNTVKYAKKKYELVKRWGYGEEWQEFFYYVYLKYALLLMVVAAANDDNETYRYARDIVKQGRLFSEKYGEYLKNNFSSAKFFVLKKLVVKKYIVARVISRMALRWQYGM